MSCLDVWVAAFDRLSEAIEQWDACCDDISTVPPGTEDVTGVDDTTIPPDVDIGDEDIPADFPTVSEYEEYLCGVAHRVADNLDGAVDTIANVLLVASNVLVFATLIVLAFGNIIGMGIAAILAGGYSLVTISEVFGFFSAFTELRELIQGGDDTGSVAQTKSELAAVHEDVVDAIACANSADDATNALHAVFNDAVSLAPFRALLKLMFSRPFIRAMFQGFVSVEPRTDCTCGALTGEITGFGFDIPYFTLNGNTGSNTNIQLQTRPVADLAYLHESTTVFLATQNLLSSGPKQSVFGNAAALAAIVADREVTGGIRTGIEDVISVRLVASNASSGTPVVAFELHDPLVYHVPTDTWVPATIGVISLDAGWTLDGNSLLFSGSMPAFSGTRSAHITLTLD